MASYQEQIEKRKQIIAGYQRKVDDYTAKIEKETATIKSLEVKDKLTKFGHIEKLLEDNNMRFDELIVLFNKNNGKLSDAAVESKTKN